MNCIEDRSKNLKSIDLIKLTRHKKFWAGTIVDVNCNFASDGIIMIDKSYVKKEKRKILEQYDNKSLQKYSIDKTITIWNNIIEKKQNYVLTLLGYSEVDLPSIDKIAYFDSGQDYICVNANKLVFINSVVNYDLLTIYSHDEFSPIVFWKTNKLLQKNEPVSILLSLRRKKYNESFDIDLNLARKYYNETKKR